MQIYDIIMLTVLLVAIVMGYRKGFAWQVASLAAIFASYFVAIRFRDVVAERIDAREPWNVFLAMLILYVGCSFTIWMLFQIIKGVIDRAKLKEFDRQMGALFGALKGGLLCVIVTFFAVTLLGERQLQAVVESRSGYVIAHVLDKANAIMPSELAQVLGPYLQQLDDRLDNGRAGEQPLIADQESNENQFEGREISDRVNDFLREQASEMTDEFGRVIGEKIDSALDFESNDQSSRTNSPDNFSDRESTFDRESYGRAPQASRQNDPYYQPPVSKEFSGPYRRR